MNANLLPTVGVLYCGDLGSAVARLLKPSGLRVVTTCADRSDRTRTRATACDIEILPDLPDVVRQSDLVLSLVLPSAATDMARRYVELSHLRPQGAVFADLNSTSLEVVSAIEEMLDGHSINYVDAAIHGGAKQLAEMGVIYVSGPDTLQVENVFRNILRVRRMGDQVGSATRMKLLIAALSKSLNALFLEIASLAQHAEMTKLFLEECHHFYPGIMEPIERMLPTYPQHAARRVGELQSIQLWAGTCEARCGMLDAAADLLQLISRIEWQAQHVAATPAGIPEIIRQVAHAYRWEALPIVVEPIVVER